MANHYLRELHRGQRYPYHQDPEAGFPYTELKSAAHYAALGVLADLHDRRGIRQELDEVDYDVRQEIVESLTGIIEDTFANFDKLENKSLGDPNEIKD